eukprot:154353-Pelagomonas_calceolata.AAC.1
MVIFDEIGNLFFHALLRTRVCSPPPVCFELCFGMQSANSTSHSILLHRSPPSPSDQQQRSIASPAGASGGFDCFF